MHRLAHPMDRDMLDRILQKAELIDVQASTNSLPSSSRTVVKLLSENAGSTKAPVSESTPIVDAGKVHPLPVAQSSTESDKEKRASTESVSAVSKSVESNSESIQSKSEPSKCPIYRSAAVKCPIYRSAA